jgi:hypothetical protein
MSSLPLRVYDGEKWVNIGVQSGQVLYQNEEPSSPQTGSIWIDSDSETAVPDSSIFATKEELENLEVLALLGL